MLKMVEQSKNLAVETPHDFTSILGHFLKLCMKALTGNGLIVKQTSM